MKYNFIDTHCDTLVRAYDLGKKIEKNDLHIDFERLEKFKSAVQFFAIWLDKKYHDNGYLKACEYIGFFDETLKNNENIQRVLTFDDIEKCIENKKVGALLALEGGEAIDGKMENLINLYNRGVRAMTLTWNWRNPIADGAGVEEDIIGLTDFGREVVLKMNEIGIAVDVSHLADKSFWDVCKVAKKPFIATHSNSRAICSHKRNLTDEQLKAMAERGCVTGLNMYSSFIVKDGRGTMDDLFKHIDHIINVGGEDILGIGCDFDGIESMPEGFTGVESIEMFLDKTADRYGERITEKISHQNFKRVLKEIL